jgi:hypothetical protein
MDYCAIVDSWLGFGVGFEMLLALLAYIAC